MPSRARGRRGRGERGGGGGGRGEAVSLQQKILDFYKAEGVVALFNRGGGVRQVRRWQQSFLASAAARRRDHLSDRQRLTRRRRRHRTANRDARRRTLQSSRPILDKGVRGEGGAHRADEVLRRDNRQRLRQHHPEAGEQPGVRDEIVLPRCALRLGRGGHRRDRQRDRFGGNDGSAAHFKTVGAKPRRTIRIGLWGGEEQGLMGSRAYVREHYGDAAARRAQASTREVVGVLQLRSGTGRVRGIFNAGQHRRRAHLPAMDGAARGPRCVRHRTAASDVDQSRVFRCRRSPRFFSSWSIGSSITRARVCRTWTR